MRESDPDRALRDFESGWDQEPVRARRRPQRSLRRRVLLTLLAISIVPATLALSLAFFSSFFTIQNTVRAQGEASTDSIAQDIDTRLVALTEPLRAALGDTVLAQAILYLQVPSFRAAFPSSRLYTAIDPIYRDAPIYLLDKNALVFGFLRAGTFVGSRDVPMALTNTPLEPVVRRMPEDKTALLFEGDRQSGVPNAWLLLRVEGQSSLDTCYLLVQIPAESIFRESERLGAAGRRLFAVASRGRGLVYISQPNAALEEFARYPPVESFASGSGVVTTPRVRDTEFAFKQIRTVSNLSVAGGSEVRWVLIQSLDLGEAKAPLRLSMWLTAVLGIVLFIGIYVFGLWAANRLVEPIFELNRGVERLASGQLDYRVSLRTGDELADLAESMNTMADNLAEAYRKRADKILELDETARQLALVHRISRASNRSLDLGEVFRQFSTELRELIPVERMSLGLVVENGNAIELAHVYPEDRKVLPGGTRLPIDALGMREALDTGTVIVQDPSEKHGAAERLLALEGGMRSICVIPLFTSGGSVGILGLSDTARNRFGPAELAILTQISEGLALAVEHSRLFTRVSSFAAELEREVRARTSDLLAAQNKLVQAEKFAATGKLATDLAHEINNPLSIIKNYLAIVSNQLMRPQTGTVDSEMTRDGIRVIEEEIDRIARIVAQLRQLNSPQKPTLKNVALVSELRSLTDLFRATFQKRRLTLAYEPLHDPGLVRLCSDYLRQIVINLLNNAADATAAGGTITLIVDRDPKEPTHFTVEVRDTGSGIAPEHLPFIFDPFFTTKKEGKGTGLGLSVSYGLANRMGGSLTCDSILGEGTRMILKLPLIPPEGTEADLPITAEDDDSPELLLEKQRTGWRIILG